MCCWHPSVSGDYGSASGKFILVGAGAPPVVAVQAHTGMAVSVAVAALEDGVSRCCLLAVLSAGALLFSSLSQLDLAPLKASAQVPSPPVSVVCELLPPLRVYVQGFHVSLADVFEAKLRPSFCSLASGQFAVQ